MAHTPYAHEIVFLSFFLSFYLSVSSLSLALALCYTHTHTHSTHNVGSDITGADNVEGGRGGHGGHGNQGSYYLARELTT